jgi:hypothetical protein
MQQVTLGALSNRETYIESFQAFDEDDTAIDMTGATIVYEVRSCKGGGTTLSATTANGAIEISTTTFTVTLTVAQTRTLCDKEYDVGCTIEIDDVVTQFFVGKLPIVDGVVS